MPEPASRIEKGLREEGNSTRCVDFQIEEAPHADDRHQDHRADPESWRLRRADGVRHHHLVYCARLGKVAVFTRVGSRIVPLIYFSGSYRELWSD